MTSGASSEERPAARDAEQRALLAIPRRFIVALLLLFFAASIVFFITHTLTDPVVLQVRGHGPEEQLQAQLQALRTELGYDRPLGER